VAHRGAAIDAAIDIDGKPDAQSFGNLLRLGHHAAGHGTGARIGAQPVGRGMRQGRNRVDDRFPHSLTQISSRMRGRTGALRPAACKAADSSVARSDFDPSGSPGEFVLKNTHPIDFTLKRCGFLALTCRVLYDFRRNPAISVPAMKHRPRLPEQDDLLRPRLVDMIDPRLKLAALIDREVFDRDWAGFFPSGKGRPATEPRLVAGLLYRSTLTGCRTRRLLLAGWKLPATSTSPARHFSSIACPSTRPR